MSERLRSIGLDVGTTSTQLILSELTVENRASSFAVPEMDITQRKILYKSPVCFTPLLRENLVDGEALKELVLAEYAAAGIRREEVDTGAIIVTGETSRRENARAVSQALAELAGDFVVVTAGPDLESALAAKGSGAVAESARTGKTILHMDIGGGTSNLALIRDGKIEKTGCLNVGGRLVKLDEAGVVTYVSPVLAGLTSLKPGDQADPAQLEAISETLVQALEMAAGLRPVTPLLEAVSTEDAGAVFTTKETAVLSFSGGVADCIPADRPWLEFGDMGPILGRCIRKSALCAGKYRLGQETIRATVIGAGCHSAQLSGSTVFVQNMPLPLKNLPVIAPEEEAPEGEGVVLAIPGTGAVSYDRVTRLAEQIAARQDRQVLVCLEEDMAKALGQALAARLGRDKPILCIDRVRLSRDSYLDVGQPVGPALPVVVKTLVWKERQE